MENVTPMSRSGQCAIYGHRQQVPVHVTVSQIHEIQATSHLYFQFHRQTFHLVLVIFVSLHQKCWIPYRLTFCSLKHSLHFRRHL